MAGPPMVVTLTLKDDLSRALTAASGVVTSTASKMAGAFKSVTDSVFSLKGAIVGALTGVALHSVLHAFAEQEAGLIGFENALRRTGKFTEPYAQSLRALAEALEKTGIASADAILAQGQLLAVNTKISAQVLPKAIEVAVNLAAAYRLDLATAMRIVTNASDGVVEGLSRYGIVIDETTAKSGDFQTVLGALAKAAGNANAEMRATTIGALTALGVAWDNLKARIGSVVAAVLVKGGVVEAFQRVVETVDGMIAAFMRTETAKNVIANLATWIVNAMQAGITAVGALATFFTSTLPIAVIEGTRIVLGALRGMIENGKQFAYVVGAIGGQEAADKFVDGMAKMGDGLDDADLSLMKARSNVEVFAESLNVDDVVARLNASLERTKGGLNETAEAAKRAAEEVAKARDAAASAGAKQGPLAFPVFDTSKIQATVATLDDWAAAGWEVVKPLHAIAAAQEDVNAATRKWKVREELPAVVEAFRQVREAARDPGDETLEGWKDFWKEVQDRAAHAYTFMSDTARTVLDGLTTFFNRTVDALFDNEIRNINDVRKIAMDTLKEIEKAIVKQLIQTAIAQGVSAVFGGAGGAGASAASSAAVTAGATGGVWDSGGFRPIPSYARGGIATESTLRYGEAGAEAYVPLPGAGRRIPVTLNREGGGGGGTVIVPVTIQALDGADVQRVLLSADGQRAIEGAIVTKAARSLRFRDAIGGRL